MPELAPPKKKDLETAEEVKSTPASADESDFTLSSSSILTTGRLTSNNFSFTFNSSESGDFIQRKKGAETPQTPFQITKMLQKRADAAAAAASGPIASHLPIPSSKSNPSNLKTIGLN